jgi:hypothetical protein
MADVLFDPFIVYSVKKWASHFYLDTTRLVLNLALSGVQIYLPTRVLLKAFFLRQR